MGEHVPEFMRYTAPNAEALIRHIGIARGKLADAVREKDELAIVDHAADLGSMLTTARREAEAIQALQAHASLAELQGEREPSAWYWCALGTALQYTGHRSEADGYFAKAVEVSRAGGWSQILAMTLQHWGRSLAEQRRFDEAEKCFSEALAIRVQLGEPRQQRSREALQALAELRRSAPVG